MIKNIVLISFLGLASYSAFSATGDSVSFGESCPDLKTCVFNIGELTGKGYILPQKMKGNVSGTPDLQLTHSNGGIILSHVLNEAGYTRIKLDENNYRIISSRDVRYNATERIYATKTKEPNFPEGSDYYMLYYKADNPIQMKHITRSFRPFLSRYGRIIHVKGGNALLIQDTSENLKRLYSLVREMDVEPTKETRKKWDIDSKRHYAIKLAKAKHCGDDK